MEIKDIISSGLLELYAAGIASDKEAAEVEQWIKQYPEVARELSEISAGVQAYASEKSLMPSLEVKEKIFARIGADFSAPVVPFKQPFTEPAGSAIVSELRPWKMAAAACAVLLVGSIILNIVTYNKYNKAGENLVATQEALNNVRAENREMSAGLDVVQSKYSVPVALKGLKAAPEAAAKIFWMKNTGEVFIDPSNLPAAPAGKRYQLWGIVDGKPVSGGMILSAGNGEKFRVQKMKSFGKVEAFAITLEPTGGNETPQGPMYVMGEMQ